MTIQILGTGCPKCKQLTANVEQAIRELGVAAEVEKVTDIKEMMKFGVMLTPGLAINGEVKSSGKVLSVGEIKKMIE
jgi:small redox-active disulfide protein 2